MIRRIPHLIFFLALIAPVAILAQDGNPIEDSIMRGLQCWEDNGFRSDTERMLHAAVANSMENESSRQRIVQAEMLRERAIRQLGLGFQAPERYYQEFEDEDGTIQKRFALPYQQNRELFKPENRAQLESTIQNICRNNVAQVGLGEVAGEISGACKDAFFKRLEMVETFFGENQSEIERLAQFMTENPQGDILGEIARYQFKIDNPVHDSALRYGTSMWLDRNVVRQMATRVARCENGLTGYMIPIQNASSGETKEIFAPITQFGVFSPIHITAADQVMDTDTFNGLVCPGL